MRLFRFSAMFLSLSVLWGCEAERYFGPYDLAVPTAIGESSSSRTFELPLDSADQVEEEDLALCLEYEPEREIPCICDYPILTLDEQHTRIDYRLENSSRRVINALVWVGKQKRSGEPDPDLLPDLPWIEVLGAHLHRMEPKETVNTSFLEEEVLDMVSAWSQDRYAACLEADRELPAPTSLLIGLSLPDEESDVVLDLEWVVRVRAGD